ncbi:hypothetical protein C0V77_10645 [Emticicia sp. TH156]|nr:hypothetical protein C0V77_10645 [Emticicia sp. TH156]
MVSGHNLQHGLLFCLSAKLRICFGKTPDCKAGSASNKNYIFCNLYDCPEFTCRNRGDSSNYEKFRNIFWQVKKVLIYLLRNCS